jgi:hypothetical protein
VAVKDVGGSTSEARWVAVQKVAQIPADQVTEVTAEALRAARLT